MTIGWVAVGSENTGSTRIGVINIHEGLLKNGYKSVLISTNKMFSTDPEMSLDDLKRKIVDNKITKLIFQKVCSPKTQQLVSFCKSRNIKTIYACGDWHETPMWSLVGKSVVGSPYFKDYLERKNIKNVHFIDDAIETLNFPIKTHKQSDKITLGWYGNFMKIESLLNFHKSLNFTSNLFIVSNSPKNWKYQADYVMGDATGVPWDTKKLADILLEKIDAIIIPTESGASEMKNNAKTSNRVTLAMSLGIPVVAYPISSYKLVIDNKVNGFLCTSLEEWRDALHYLSFVGNREKIGLDGVNMVRKKYSVDSIIKDWISL